MIDFWLSKNVADTLYGLIVLAMFFIIMFIVSAIKSVFNRHNKKKFYKQFCIRCGCVFSFEKEDVELKEINGHWTGAVTCPECKADNKVERW